MSNVYSVERAVSEAINFFGVYTGETPKLIPTGIKTVDDSIGGLAPGACGLLAAKNGVGKSSIMLHAALHSTDPVGIISCEDTPDVVGSRLLSIGTGINSLNFRRGTTRPDQLPAIRAAEKRLAERQVHFRFCIGKGLDEVVKSVQELAAAGCKFIWLDYVQKVRGHAEDRRQEVARCYTGFQAACGESGAAGMVLSQLSRAGEVKETSDMEDECRLFVFAEQEKDNERLIRCYVRKSSYGIEKNSFLYRRKDCGSLTFLG